MCRDYTVVPYYRDRQKGTPNFGKPHWDGIRGAFALGLRLQGILCLGPGVLL